MCRMKRTGVAGANIILSRATASPFARLTHPPKRASGRARKEIPARTTPFGRLTRRRKRVRNRFKRRMSLMTENAAPIAPPGGLESLREHSERHALDGEL